MDESIDRRETALLATSRMVTADTSESQESSSEPALSALLELSLDALLQRFRRA